MENINSLRDLLRLGDFIATVDLKDAYFTVPIQDDYLNYLRFCWNSLLCEFLALPFGLSSAPRIFTKIMKPDIRSWQCFYETSYRIFAGPSDLPCNFFGRHCSFRWFRSGVPNQC